MAHSILAFLPHELSNLFLFFLCLIKVGLMTGLILVPFVVFGYEFVTRKRVRRG